MTQPRETRPQPAAGAEIGSLIGGAFGLVFLIINSASFSTLGRILVLIMGIAAFAVIVFFAIRSLGRMKRAHVSSATSVESAASAEPAEPAEGQVAIAEGQAAAGPRRTVPFGRSYWIIVGIEALALFGGTRLLSGLGHPELGVAWVAFVVGTHFYALGHVFKLDRFHILATVVTLCGIAGFIAFFASIPAFIPIFSGIISGFVLLAFGLWALVAVDDR
ncbi:hypothetical protein [Brevibacterium sp. UCMA 11752]|uniref:hypothetical protein n=1 Tax=Brevibacterium sp. UCMA 11752 TaxID=2745946 RepID=UPI001F23FAF1|nr:hypothetical protein [Brevibacterium sp. UCMA 11752]MCF2586376.1 hypothetical protein [Brevibacterium sp. UCMA 11752]